MKSWNDYSREQGRPMKNENKIIKSLEQLSTVELEKLLKQITRENKKLELKNLKKLLLIYENS
ncbi:MAG: hypothetical protein HFH46_02060 [Bacilli bacterium]|nr:hypothetical protein [Bacilli bacterium]